MPAFYLEIDFYVIFSIDMRGSRRTPDTSIDPSKSEISFDQIRQHNRYWKTELYAARITTEFLTSQLNRIWVPQVSAEHSENHTIIIVKRSQINDYCRSLCDDVDDISSFPLHGWLVRVYLKFDLIGAWKFNQIRWDFQSNWDSLDPTELTNNTKKCLELLKSRCVIPFSFHFTNISKDYFCVI